MRILVLGGGGREHAICWKLSQSPLLTRLFCAPGNAGIAQVAECIELNHRDHVAIVEFAQSEGISLVVVGPEDPLVGGVADALRLAGIPCFGPDALGAQLEGSKAFMKQLCDRQNIRTAAYAVFTHRAEAEAYIRMQGAPIVVKADGLAAGKGVTVANSVEEALAAVEEAFGGRFGAAGQTVVVEEFLEGVEVSFFALTNGETAVALGAAQDHKAAGEGDTGPNTGGMGTYSPPPMFTPELEQEVMRDFILPTVAGLKAIGSAYRGVLFAGLMLTAKGIYLLEYNVRFGDPETQVLMQRLDSDLLSLLLAIAKGEMPPPIRLRSEAALCVVMAARGYPGEYRKGTVIRGIDAADAMSDVTVFHAGTIRRDGALLADGGRVLGVTARGATIRDAQILAYRAVDAIDWADAYFRRDIGWRAV